MYRIIDEYRHRGADSPDLLSAMVGSRGEDDDALTDRELRDNVVTFIFGGTETTAALLSWCLYFLGRLPDVERALHDEVDRVLDGRTPVFADVPRLEHTGRIVSEALRLYAPGWIFTRVTLTDTELAGRPVPAGTVLIYCPYLLHRRRDLFPDPDRFHPDRWLNRGSSSAPHSYAPFGIGTRKCIGDVFGRVEATLALAIIASRWRLRPVPNEVVKPRPRMTLVPHPLRMRIEERRPSV
ncbi:cytochrome P450 [Actinokineospora soli]|uniref:Cytochrome P450 n=1 Tax=Actinokineospora soli TaxID=1048753 RepID=A0ABW2TYC5_9PSEU